MKKITLGVVALAMIFSFSTAGAATYNFQNNLTLGSTGSDVVALQTMLVSKGYLVMPSGVPMGYFGALTQSAVVKFQIANKVSPTSGYFGPLTRGVANLMNSDTGSNNGGSTGTLNGGDGDFRQFKLLGSPSNKAVEEGGEEKVLGFEFEADDSDLMIERLDIQVTGNGNTAKPWKYIDSLVLYNGDKEVASVDADEKSDWDEQDSDEYEITIEDIDEIVREGKTAKFYVEVVLNDSIDDSDLPLNFTMFLSNDGLRAVNAEGINVYEGSEGQTKNFTIKTVAEGDIDVTVRASDNEDKVVSVDEDDETDEVVIYTAEIESKDGDNAIDEVTVNLATTTGTTNGLSDFIGTLYLYIDGEEVGSESVNSDLATESITFDDIDFDLEDGDSVDLVVKADILEQDGNYTNNSTGVYVTGISLDFTDSNDDDQTVTDTTDGGDITFGVNGASVQLSGTPSAVVSYGRYAGDNDRGTFTITFKVTAFGDEDIYIGGEGSTGEVNSGINYTLSSSTAAIITQAELTSTADKGDNGTFVINSGDTETFTFTVEVQDADTSAADVAQKLTITGIKWDTEDTETPANTYTNNLKDLKTPSKTI